MEDTSVQRVRCNCPPLAYLDIIAVSGVQVFIPLLALNNVDVKAKLYLVVLEKD